MEKVKLEKLEILYLNYNKISDAKIFEKVNLKNLKELYLNNNKFKKDEIESIRSKLETKFNRVYL